MKMFTGLIPPMVTPLAAPDALDVESTERMVMHLLDVGSPSSKTLRDE